MSVSGDPGSDFLPEPYRTPRVHWTTSCRQAYCSLERSTVRVAEPDPSEYGIQYLIPRGGRFRRRRVARRLVHRRTRAKRDRNVRARRNEVKSFGSAPFYTDAKICMHFRSMIALAWVEERSTFSAEEENRKPMNLREERSKWKKSNCE